MFRCCSSPFFDLVHHPAFCCSLVRHRADNGSESENRASVSLFPFPPLSRFPLSLGFECAPAHGSLSPRSVKRAAYGRVTDSGFKKKL